MRKPALAWLLLLICVRNFQPAMAQDETSEFLGDMGGLRSALGSYGTTLAIEDQENLLANVAGGVKTGATLQGETTVTLQMDTGKSLGVQNGVLTVSGLQIHGQNFSPYYLDDIQEANGDEAENSTMLLELSYDQIFPKAGLDIKLGQQSIDSDFVVCADAGVFMNTMASWPAAISDDTYAGGPVAPFAALGLRAKYQISPSWMVLGGVFDDNPMDSPTDVDQADRDNEGLAFSLNTGAFFIAELQKTTTLGNDLAGSYEVGVWYDTARFPDQHIGTDGLSLANPESNGIAKTGRQGPNMYGVADQTVWQQQPARSLNFFAIVMGAPGPQNLVSFSFTGGFTLSDPLPGRAYDTVGVDIGIVTIGAGARALDRDQANYSGGGYPIRSAEGLIELTYIIQATPWLSLQPDFQYIVNPGAGVPDPLDPADELRDEVVVGTRATVTF